MTGPAIRVFAIAVALCAAMPVTLGTAAGSRPMHDSSGNLEGQFNAGLVPTRLSKTKPSPVTVVFSARVGTTDGSPVPAVSRVSFETDKRLSLDLERSPRCSLAQLRGADDDASPEMCQRAIVGSGSATVQSQSQPSTRQPIERGPQILVFNGGTKNGVTTLLVHVSIPEPVTTSIVFPLKVRPIEDGRFGLSWVARIPEAAGASTSFTSLNLRLLKGLSATCPDGKLVGRGGAEFADGNDLTFRLSHDCMTVSPQARTVSSGIVIPQPHLFTTFSAAPSPMPTPSEGRIPVSLRLADSIWTDDGSHPPAAEEVRFSFDRQLRLDLSGVPRCRWAPAQSYPAFDWSGCEPATLAGGRIKWEVAFPEQEAFRTGGEATAYRGRRNELLIRTYVPAPVSGEVVIPVKLSPVSEGRYGFKATASVPKIADGSGSLVYLGLRFRKGLFSAACPDGRLQSGVTASFADGNVAGGSVINTC